MLSMQAVQPTLNWKASHNQSGRRHSHSRAPPCLITTRNPRQHFVDVSALPYLQIFAQSSNFDKIQTQFSGGTDPKSCAAQKMRPNHPRSTRTYQSHELTTVTGSASTPLVPRPRQTEASRLTCYQPVNRTFTAPSRLVPVPTSEVQLATLKLDESSQPARPSFTRRQRIRTRQLGQHMFQYSPDREWKRLSSTLSVP